MSDRAKTLLNAIIAAMAVHGGSRTVDKAVARAICEHLGVTWEDVTRHKSSGEMPGSSLTRQGSCGTWDFPQEEINSKRDHMVWHYLMADRIATLLEAAGIER